MKKEFDSQHMSATFLREAVNYSVSEYGTIESTEECPLCLLLSKLQYSHGSARATCTLSARDFSLYWFVVPNDEEV